MKKIYLTIIIVLVAIIGTYIFYQAGAGDQETDIAEGIKEGINIGDKAPDFTLNKMNGDQISLSELRGQKVFLNFWASWCGPCRIEMPDIQKLHNEHEEISILAVNVQEDNQTVVNFMMDNSYHFPVVLDKTGNISGKYAVRGLPTTYILDENGVIMSKVSGVLSYERMLELLEVNND
ncbi:MAG: TlpA family protein disulfide reductase [bacterium]